jgi:hypothetical protein
MTVSLSVAWKLTLALALAVMIFLSAYADAPRYSVPGADLRRLVAGALMLYAVGGVASLTHHSVLAGLVSAAGIALCALAAWLSRGTDSEDPPPGDAPADEEPPPEPDGMPTVDWAAFERDFCEYSERSERESLEL